MEKKIIKKWTHKQLNSHLKKNLTQEDAGYCYGAAVVVAALHKKLYAEFPKIGMSGAQAGFANSIIPLLPEPNPNAKHMT